MKDSPEANFPIHFTISYDTKKWQTNLQKKIYSNIHEKYSPLIFIYVYWLPNNFMRYARVFSYKFILLHICWSHLTARRVSQTCWWLSMKNVCLNLSRTKNNWKMQFLSKIAGYMLVSSVKGACLQVFCNDLAKL